MRLTIVQTALTWEDKKANLHHLTQLIAPCKNQTDLLVLPEMFTTGFTMNAAAVAETMDGETVQWALAQSKALDAAIAGSFICREGSAFFNRLIFATPEGNLFWYDKKHLFSLAGEHETFTAGNKQEIIEYRGWRICPFICYDLRFPVWSRNTAPYDLAIYTANWPSARAHQWRSLLPARAIENQAYVAGVNIVGTDGKGLNYEGDSMILDFQGKALGHIASQTAIFTAILSLEKLKEYRQQLPFLLDRDHFSLIT